MTPTSPSVRSLRRRGLAAGLVLVPALVITGCSQVGDVVRDAAQEGAKQVRHSVEDVVGDTLGKVQVSTDGHIPDSFPADAVPFPEGKLLGGGAAPDGAGWVAQVAVPEVEGGFADARTRLEAAGYASSEIASDAQSGYGRFTTDAYTVIVTVSADPGSPVATYVVLPAG
ncbi:hypothetical protein DZG00_10110 [Clavibacter lycopersici]|uniref:Uncharacterized protein n=1 Tax=Clavibacter lycopersici TaxID=2301718 RepID=A0A399T425_9MICO|nr:hypothetical protein [Clavibacter lycopersici]RIJ51120.1 hypothetical protein DZG00_10110 [Clavibacter lycopersici]RIJ61485.1 hypothetical protein DZG02_06770 [Clavibacter lycopersici]